MEASGIIEACNTAINAVVEDEGVDGVVVVLAVFKGMALPYDLDILKEERRLDKPLLFCIIRDKDYVELMTGVPEKRGFPVYPDIARAVKALAVMHRYNAQRKRL